VSQHNSTWYREECMCHSFLWFNVHVYFSKAKTLEWNLYPGLKIWKELPAVRKTQSPAYMGLKGLLDFESPEDLGIDSGDQEGGLAKNGPKRTKDSAFSAELQQALAMMEDLIKSCELAVDLAAVTGCPVRAVASVGTVQQRAGTILQR